jgi:hypothetical protein
MSQSNVTLEFSNFRALAEATKAYGAEIVAETANAIESDVKGAWGKYKIPVVVRWSASRGMGKAGALVAGVVAGNAPKFYVLFIEFGGNHWSGDPAMVPSAERHRPDFVAKAGRLEEALSSVG